MLSVVCSSERMRREKESDGGQISKKTIILTDGNNIAIVFKLISCFLLSASLIRVT